ncbi:hypothetical protein, partial [Thiolapillus sp.]|uniref:hypothetical protein n=1 Tax=Thiolapillus sp. TaxID=2017437 RepID=UPI003AF4C459
MAKRHGRRTAGAIMVVALVSRFWRLGCPKIYHEVATRLVPFTSSMTSNLWRCLESLFGIEMKQKRFYTFMSSTLLPWQ